MLLQASFSRHFAKLSLVTALFSTMANAENTEVPYSSGWGFSGYVDSQSIDSKVAKEEKIADSVTVIGFAGERYNNANNRTFNIGLDLLLYDDKAGFSQTTENEWNGDIQDSDSTATGVILYADYGPRYSFGKDKANYFTARGGFGFMVESERSISNCSNCFSQDIDVEGGAYGLVGVGHSFGSFALGLQLKQYLTGDLGTGIGIKLSSSY